MRTLLDANAVLRHLLDDVPEQAAQATAAIEQGAQVTPEVIAECVYVLQGVYGVGRADIANVLESLLDEVACARSSILKRALSYYGASRLDFVDCILWATNQLTGQPVLTFDKRLRAHLAD